VQEGAQEIRATWGRGFVTLFPMAAVVLNSDVGVVAAVAVVVVCGVDEV
jgi:hypothetical protein